MAQAPEFMRDVDTSETKSPASLEEARKLAKEYFDLNKKVEDLEIDLEKAKKERNDLQMRKIPELFGRIQIDNVGLPEEEVDVKVVPYCKAGISSEWPIDQQEAGFKVLEDLDGGDIIRAKLTVEFQTDEFADAKELQEHIRTTWSKANLHPSRLEKAVHWGTLTSFIKDYIKDESVDPLTEEQKKALGATIGSTAKIQKRKAK